MKHGTKPTRAQKILLRKRKLNPDDWLIERETPEKLVLVHRHFDRIQKVIHKENANGL